MTSSVSSNDDDGIDDICYDRILPEECYEYAENELNETNATRTMALREIREWLKSERFDGHFVADIKWILFFLRGTKFDVERTKDKMKRFHTLRQEIPEWFSDRHSLNDTLQELLEIGVYLPLLKRSSDNCRVIVIRACAHDPKRHTLADVFKLGMMLIDLLISTDELMSIYGIRAIFDMRNAKFGHGMQFTPGIVRNAVRSWETYPTRIKGLEFIFIPKYVVVMLNIFRSFMSSKLKSRVRITKDSSNLDPEILPTDLGGKESSYAELADYWREKLAENSGIFLDK